MLLSLISVVAEDDGCCGAHEARSRAANVGMVSRFMDVIWYKFVKLLFKLSLNINYFAHLLNVCSWGSLCYQYSPVIARKGLYDVQSVFGKAIRHLRNIIEVEA